MSAPTIAANLRKAARDREAVSIGGGAFTYDELREAARLIETSADLLTMCVEMREVYRRKRRTVGCDGYDHGIMDALDRVIAKAGQ